MRVYSKENIEKRQHRIKIIISIVKIILTVILLPILLLNLILFLKSIFYPQKIPDIFGYKVFLVVSPSMSPEINSGDLILINKNKKPSINDIVTYKDNDIITHRVVRITEDKEYIVKGDNNINVDMTLVNAENFEGTVIYKFRSIGRFIVYLQNPFVVIAILMFIIAMYYDRITMEKRRFIRKIKRINYENKL